MRSGVSGTLISGHFADHLIASSFRGELGEDTRAEAHRKLRDWWASDGRWLGPSSTARAIRDRAAVPLAALLGFDAPHQPAIGEDVALLAGLWTDDLDALWRGAVRVAVQEGTRWCLCTNGHQLRLIDAVRTYSRAHLQFDLARTVDDPRVFALFWSLLRADAFRGVPDAQLISRAIHASAQHGLSVSRALRHGVIQAVGHLLGGLLAAGRGRAPLDDAMLARGFDESLTLVHRILFLLFAESRALVPIWHPLYRERYTIESLREQAEGSSDPRGIWESLQAIARLAHDGCHAGTLTVSAFNGRLFSPRRAPLSDSCRIQDDIARDALVALSSGAADRRSGRVRIDYRDLGVEQLGAVYETLLDYAPVAVDSPAPRPTIELRRGGDQRKATGSFYTPQPITDYLVRRTLHPLTASAAASEILALRILDPAMGSGAFLVSACRYLAASYEQALIREGTVPGGRNR